MPAIATKQGRPRQTDDHDRTDQDGFCLGDSKKISENKGHGNRAIWRIQEGI